MTAIDASFDLLEAAPAGGLFYSSSRLTVLEHFRVPYELDPALGGELEQLYPSDGAGALLWKRDLDGPVVASTLLGADQVTEIPLFTRLLSDELTEPLLCEHGGSWERARRIVSADGTPVASIWRAEDGSVFLPFDPDDVVESFWT